MATDTVKKGDLLFLLRQLYQAGTAFDCSASKYLILVTGHDTTDTSTKLFNRRDVTTSAKANGTPSVGKLAIPLWDGRGAPGSSGTVTVTDHTTNGKVSVTVPASGASGGTITQELYRTTAGGSTYYLVASFADGAYASSPYTDNTADASLTQAIHTDDQSATNTYSALAVGTTPTPALAGAGAGNLSNGVYLYKTVTKRDSDTATVRDIEWEITVYDNTTAKDVTWPSSGFELLQIKTEA